MAKHAGANADTTAYIYGLRDKKSKLYFYIGSTRKTPIQRMRKHIELVNAGRHTRRFSEAARRVGIDNIVVDTIATVTEGDRFVREYEHIKWHRALGHPLANIVSSPADERRYYQSRTVASLMRLDPFDFVRMMNIIEFDPPYAHYGHPIQDALRDGIIGMFQEHAADVLSIGKRKLKADNEARQRLERIIGMVA